LSGGPPNFGSRPPKASLIDAASRSRGIICQGWWASERRRPASACFVVVAVAAASWILRCLRPRSTKEVHQGLQRSTPEAPRRREHERSQPLGPIGAFGRTPYGDTARARGVPKWTRGAGETHANGAGGRMRPPPREPPVELPGRGHEPCECAEMRGRGQREGVTRGAVLSKRRPNTSGWSETKKQKTCWSPSPWLDQTGWPPHFLDVRNVGVAPKTAPRGAQDSPKRAQ